MIHAVYLPPRTKARLGHLVAVQMALIEYAMQAGVGKMGEESCKEFLSHKADLAPWAGAIAYWLFTGSRRPALDCLRRFQEQLKGHEKDAARAVEWMLADIEALADARPVKLQFRTAKHEVDWQETLAAYFECFYASLTRGIDGALCGIDNCYSRQDILRDFVAHNRGLVVCPMCDETVGYTVANGHIRTDLEHFFPKSRYPHLSCHPYNLIPICKNCNQSIHGGDDPLCGDGRRLRLDEIMLPYREGNVAAHALALVQATDSGHGQGGFAFELRSTGETLDGGRLDTLDRVYQIPGRWNGRADAIGEQLFRRLRQFWASREILDDKKTMEETRLLARLMRADIGAEPWALACFWWLVELLLHEEKSEASPLVAEIHKMMEDMPREASSEPTLDLLVERARAAYAETRQ